MNSIELLHHYRRLSLQPLTVVDVETTGRYATAHRITELSVLSGTVSEGITDQQSDLVNSQVCVPDLITNFTGITQAMVDAAPLTADVLPRYLSQLNSGILTAHNLEFDYAFLKVEYARIGVKYVRPEAEQLCTVQLARLLLPDLPSRSLPDLVRHFGFQVGRSHRAEADTIACFLLAQRLLTEIDQEDDDLLLKRFARQWLPLRLTADLMGCSLRKAQSQLEAAGVEPRSDRHKPMYQRGDVERLLSAAIERL